MTEARMQGTPTPNPARFVGLSWGQVITERPKIFIRNSSVGSP